ncbi:hypothetical protein VCRA2112O187_3380001 [Vibrio crassostreae]|nr:hypothetical protein VCRA2112O187_3380001 [Vibrio crassostreae]
MWLSFICIIVTIVTSYMGWFVDKCEPTAPAFEAEEATELSKQQA